jgi:hypothetical protein
VHECIPQVSPLLPDTSLCLRDFWIVDICLLGGSLPGQSALMYGFEIMLIVTGPSLVFERVVHR